MCASAAIGQMLFVDTVQRMWHRDTETGLLLSTKQVDKINRFFKCQFLCLCRERLTENDCPVTAEMDLAAHLGQSVKNINNNCTRSLRDPNCTDSLRSKRESEREQNIELAQIYRDSALGKEVYSGRPLRIKLKEALESLTASDEGIAETAGHLALPPQTRQCSHCLPDVPCFFA